MDSVVSSRDVYRCSPHGDFQTHFSSILCVVLAVTGSSNVQTTHKGRVAGSQGSIWYETPPQAQVNNVNLSFIYAVRFILVLIFAQILLALSCWRYMTRDRFARGVGTVLKLPSRQCYIAAIRAHLCTL